MKKQRISAEEEDGRIPWNKSSEASDEGARGKARWKREAWAELKRTLKERLDARLLAIYYRGRSRLGLERISQERLRAQRLLQPEADAEQALQKEDARRIEQVLLCLVAIGLLTFVVWHQGRGHYMTSLVRPDYGEASEDVILELTAQDEVYEVPVTIRSLQYSEEEVEEKVEEAWEKVQKTALGNNKDWNHVSENLDLGTDTGVPGITVSWRSKDHAWISSGGEVAEVEDEEDAVAVVLAATLFYEGASWEKEITARVVAPSRSSMEEQTLRFRDSLAEILSDRREKEIELPRVLDGQEITYPEEERTPTWMLPALGLLAAVAVWLLPEQRRRDAWKKRERELEASYSELIWKLTVLLGAGLTVRGAWERIVRNYQKELQKGGRKMALYDEMTITLNSLSQGVYEEKAYAEFGRRCGLPPYLRLGSLLETNVRQGRKGLVEQMQNEAEEAFQGRLQLAKRQGEEASSKLLLPMMVLFALVLGIIMVPALFSFN